MGHWACVPGAVTGVLRQGGPKRLVSGGESSPEDKARMAEMIAERRPAQMKPTWRPESTRTCLGREVQSRSEFEAILKRRGLTEHSGKSVDADVKRPTIDIDKIQREAFVKGRQDIAQGKVPVPKKGEAPIQAYVAPITSPQPGFGSMQAMFEDAKRRIGAGAGNGLVGGTDTGEPTMFAFTEPKATQRRVDDDGLAETWGNAQKRMVDKLYERGALGT